MVQDGGLVSVSEDHVQVYIHVLTSQISICEICTCMHYNRIFVYTLCIYVYMCMYVLVFAELLEEWTYINTHVR